MDTPVTPVMDTPATPDVTPDVPATPAPAQTFSWKTQLNPDFANSPTMQKYTDTKEGFNDAVKAHLELQKMLGNEKVPIPKGPDDPAMSLFKKALKIPEKPEGYGLADAEIPENLKGISLDKNKFSETVHKFNLTPEQAKGLWGQYTEMVKQQYSDLIKKQEEMVTNSIDTLRSEWGDAYQSKVELGQMVINKFSSDQDVNDFITATLSKDPRGIKFLSQIGNQFAENKIGDFKYQRHSLTPEEIEREISSIKNDMNHPYRNPNATEADHNKAVEYVNDLYRQLSKFRTR